MKVKKTCEKCGKPYLARVSPKRPIERSKYCSRACQIAAHAERNRKGDLTKTCKVCGNEFTTRRHHGGNKTCSKECADKSRGRPGVIRKQAFTSCAYCGAFLLKPQSRIAEGKNDFCNHECKAAYQHEQGRLELVCKTCGKTYVTIKAQLEHRGSSYCSRECQAEAKSLAMRGENNPNYKGGIEYPVDYGPNWGRQKRKARKRDNYSCQSCGKKRKGLDVHHIKPIREFNGDWESANQVDNLVTLCRNCHMRIEYGYLCLLPHTAVF